RERRREQDAKRRGARGRGLRDRGQRVARRDLALHRPRRDDRHLRRRDGGRDPAGARRAGCDPGLARPAREPVRRGGRGAVAAGRGPRRARGHRRAEPAAALLRPGRRQLSLKFTVTVMMTGTATPFSSVGVYSHCRTAATAASLKSGMLRSTLVFTTWPVGLIVHSRTTTP